MTSNHPGLTPPSPEETGHRGAPLFVRAALSLYPPRWRERYGEELASLLTDLFATATWPARAGLLADTAMGALDAHLNPPGGKTMSDRIRGSLTVTACAIMAFAIATVGFQKMTEDPAFSAAARNHPAIAASSGLLRAAAVAAAVTVLAGALPLAWNIIRQAISAHRPDLIRLLLIPPAAVAGWLAIVAAIARMYQHPHVHSAANIATVAAIALLGLAAATACTWAAVTILHRADLTPRVLRPQVIPMAILTACAAVTTAADITWGLAVRSADSPLFHSDNGLIATPMPPSWIAGVAMLATVTVLTASATMRATRALHTAQA